MVTESGTTKIKLTLLLQVIFDPRFSPHIKESSVYERDSVHQVVNYTIKWCCLWFLYNTLNLWNLYKRSPRHSP